MATNFMYGWDADASAWVKLVCNAAGKLIIDPSEILEDTPTDGEVGKAPTSNWAFDRGLKAKVVDIGGWNMDTTNQVNANHGLTLANIRAVEAMVRDNTAAVHYPAKRGGGVTDGAMQLWISQVTATNVQLQRLTGGFFDNSAFNSAVINRGWVTLWYV